MNVLLKPELEQFIAEKVSGGQYRNASAIVNETLEVFMEQEQFTPEHEAYLGREVRRGIDQLKRGERAQCDAEKIIAEERQRADENRSG